MLRKHHGVEFLSAVTLTLVGFVYFSFVDDTDLPVTGELHSRGEDLTKPFQEALNRWASGLTVTRGELAPQKSWCYLIEQVWTGRKWRYRTIAEMPGTLTLMDQHGQH